MSTRKLMGMTLAATAALAFAVAPVTSTFAQDATTTQVKCSGTNACKGQSACKSAKNACTGKNSCKGQGFTVMSSSEDCTKANGTVLKEQK